MQTRRDRSEFRQSVETEGREYIAMIIRIWEPARHGRLGRRGYYQDSIRFVTGTTGTGGQAGERACSQTYSP